MTKGIVKSVPKPQGISGIVTINAGDITNVNTGGVNIPLDIPFTDNAFPSKGIVEGDQVTLDLSYTLSGLTGSNLSKA